MFSLEHGASQELDPPFRQSSISYVLDFVFFSTNLSSHSVEFLPLRNVSKFWPTKPFFIFQHCFCCILFPHNIHFLKFMKFYAKGKVETCVFFYFNLAFLRLCPLCFFSVRRTFDHISDFFKHLPYHHCTWPCRNPGVYLFFYEHFLHTNHKENPTLI